MLREGESAPLDIVVEDQDGNRTSLRDHLGRKVVVYFYPRDNTPGCTKEACAIRDAWEGFDDLGVLVFGVSTDDGKSHRQFIRKHRLPFSLLCDPDHELAEAFGAWGEKKMFGRSYMGMIRSSFVIDRKGRILKAYPRVKPASHARELLDDLKGG